MCSPTRRKLVTIDQTPHPGTAYEPPRQRGGLTRRLGRPLLRLRHAAGAILVVGVLAAGVGGCGSSGERTENTGEAGIPAPTVQEEAAVGAEGAEGGVAGSKQEAAELLEQTKE